MQKKAGIKLVMDKMYDYACMAFQREEEEKTTTPSSSTANNNNNQKQTTTTTPENRQDNNSSDAEVQQLLYDHRCFKGEIQAAI